MCKEADVSRRKRLRELVEAKQGLIVPGAYDGVSARLVEAAGFDAVYMTGYGTSASRLGLPDMGFAGLAEMSDQARNLAAAVSIPLIADADTGYGNALNVRRTVRAYEAAGVAAMHIEDQSLPKRCGHMAGKQVVPAEEFAAKIRAATEVREDHDLIIIARTDAIAVTGFDDALHRAELASKAGADMLFIEAPETEAQFEKIAASFDLPLLFNYTTSGQRTPFIPIEELRRLRYAVIIMPTQSLLIATQAVQSFLTRLRAGEDARALSSEGMAWSEFNTFIGADEQMAIGEKYGS
jgi:2-methylisocitrate lyase-like PEP mutase family enzyme